ncbi:hypothetical protein GEMRC1_001947 [Eukaryota sp. GEM-RC1]
MIRLNYIDDNCIIPFIVSGETGSGKSVLTGVVVVMVTLEPIIVCQPRILPATKLSNFINDLCDTTFPLSGYRTGNKNTNIPLNSHRFIEVQTAAYTSKFITNNKNVEKFMTIMVDEVHERKCDIDILLAQLRIISRTPRSPLGHKLRVVVCSATMDTPNPCFRYLTQDCRNQSFYLNCENNYTIHATGRTNPLVVVDYDCISVNTFFPDTVGSQLIQIRLFEDREVLRHFKYHFCKIYQYFTSSVCRYYSHFVKNLNPISHKSINFKALAQVCLCYYSLAQSIFKRFSHCEGFTLLVFLPGSPEITTLTQYIENEYTFLLKQKKPDLDVSRTVKPNVHPLYSSLDSNQQDTAVAKPMENQFKIVLATNIAESSLTIDGVKFVIDCGLSKQTDVDDLLETYHCSIASLDQRSGRAGRNSAGFALRLVSTKFLPNRFPRLDYDKPEILTCSLIEPLLTMKQIATDPTSFINELPDIPSSENILSTVDVLFRNNVLTQNNLDSELTCLGKLCSKANISFFNFKFLFYCVKNDYLSQGLIMLAGINSMSFLRCHRTFDSFYDLFKFSESIDVLKSLSTLGNDEEISEFVCSDMFLKLSLVDYIFRAKFTKLPVEKYDSTEPRYKGAIDNLSRYVHLKKLERYLNELRSLVSRFQYMEDSPPTLVKKLVNLKSTALMLLNFVTNPSESTLVEFLQQSSIFVVLFVTLQIQQ